MAEVNPNLIVAGLKTETVRGTAETLVEADFDTALIDAELVQYSTDHSPVGKLANGKLINGAKSYSRSRAGTGAIKMEIKATATPLVKPNYFEVLENAGFKTGVIEAAVNDNFEAYYDGTPSCNTCTYETRVQACDGTGYVKGLKGAVITDAKLTIEGAGAPLMFSGTVSGAYFETALTASAFTPTEDAGDCVLGTGMIATRGATVVNFTKFEYSLNLGAMLVPDMSDSANTNISHANLSDGGDPTMTSSFIPLQVDAAGDWADLFANTVEDTLVFENADMKILVEGVQYVDLQDTNETGVLVRDVTDKAQGIRLQLK